MPFSTAGQLARSVVTARANDSLGLVAENLRESPHGVLPVLDRPTFGPDDPAESQARVVGLVSARELSRATQRLLEPAIASNGAGASNGAPTGSREFAISAEEPESIETEPAAQAESLMGTASLESLTARDVMRADVPYIPAAFSLHNALLALERYDLPALPVLDEAHRYRGLVSRADLLAGIARSVRPPLVGGMATPLGVYLTDGRLSGGAGPLGLFLSGLSLAVGFILSWILLALVLWPFSTEWAALALSGRLAATMTENTLFGTAAVLLHGLFFLLFFRLLPLSGFHAAEHQVVHALEKGLPLEPQYVAKMPRAHPRCGTNLTIAAGLVLIGAQHLPDLGPGWILFLLVFTFFFWRSFGTFVQNAFTTRPPSPGQLEQGIAAAQELMAKYQAQPNAHAPLPLRLFNSGMLWTALGMMGGLFVLQFVLLVIARAILGG